MQPSAPSVTLRSAYLVVLFIASGVTTGAAAAQPAPPSKPDSLTHAEVLLDEAQLSTDAVERFHLADEAATLCRQAAKERPRDPEPVLKLVRALTVADPAHPESCRPGRCEAAVVLLQKLERTAPLYASRIAAEEGIVLSRMQRFSEALLAYERAMPLVEPARRPNVLDERPGSVLLWGNSAETAMALGRLDEAIRRFEIALDRATYAEPEWQLALYGLAVALDRDGQVERARLTIQRALERDPSLQRMRDDGVFFEPPGDVFYYTGLAHEVAGDAARAKDAFQEFLIAQPSSLHAVRARAHLALLRKAPPLRPATVELGVPMSVKGTRDRVAILSQVRSHALDLAICYERHLREQPGQALSLQLAIEISPSGYVGGRAQVLSSSDSALTLSRCVELAAGGWRFAATDGAGAQESDAALIPISFGPAR